MAIKTQNKTLGVFALITLIILALVLFREGKMTSFLSSKNSELAEKDASLVKQEQMGDQVNSGAGDDLKMTESQKNFAQIVGDLSDCLDIKSSNEASKAAVQIETLIQRYQGELGPVSHQSDRWMNWHMRNPEGKERRLRLEITENDVGKIDRELHFYSVDREGLPVPIEIDAVKSRNPSDEVINQMLKEGEVFHKERAAFVVFPGGERLEYVEKNGLLSEIEFIKNERIFRCNNLEARENCQCIR